VGDVPFHLKFALKVSNPSPKSADLQYLLITSEPLKLAKNVQLSRIGSRPRAFQRAIDEVHTLRLTPSKGSSKTEFVVFVNNIQVQSDKVCYTVTLCKNFQRQSCRITVPLSNGVYMLTVNVTLKLIFSPKLTHSFNKSRFRRINVSVGRASDNVQL